MFAYPKTLIWWIVLFRVGGRCLVKLVAAKVIRQHMFSLHYLISSIIIFERKKDIYGLSHENHDKWPNVTGGDMCRGILLPRPRILVISSLSFFKRSKFQTRLEFSCENIAFLFLNKKARLEIASGPNGTP